MTIVVTGRGVSQVKHLRLGHDLNGIDQLLDVLLVLTTSTIDIRNRSQSYKNISHISKYFVYFIFASMIPPN